MSDRSSDNIAIALDKLRTSSYDEEGWRILYRELWPFVVTTVARTLGSYDESVQDVAQETFLRLLRAGPASDFQSPSALRAYLRLAAINTARTHQRKLWRERRVLSESPPEHEDDVPRSEGADADLLESESVNVVLAQLEETDRQLVAYLIDGLPLSEIATALGISYSAAGVRLHRLRRRLRNLLSHNDIRQGQTGR